MKTLLILWLSALSSLAALPPGITGKTIHEYPNNSNPPLTVMILIDPGNGVYNQSTLGQIAAVFANSGLFTNGSGTIIFSNASFTYITNFALFTTNVTIEVPGGFTNLNVTANTVGYWGAGKDEESVPNGLGVMTNNGTGGVGFSTTISLAEVDTVNFFPTNTFLTLTNKMLSTDGNGQVTNLIVDSSLNFANNLLSISNTTVTPGTYGDGTHVAVVTVNSKGQATTVTSTAITGAAPSGAAGGDLFGTYPNPSVNFLAATNYTDRATNRAITVTGTANRVIVTGSPVVLGGTVTLNGPQDINAGATPAFGGINFTNLGYGLPTNNLGGGAFVFGGPGTAATLYDTNITAATTLKLFDITACGATAGGFKLYATCSGGTDRILTFPAGCSGAGLGTPPAVTITNAKAAFFDVIYKPGATPVTNVFWSPVY